MQKRIETGLEKLIFGSRWLLAPFYIGLVVCLGILLVKFVQELMHDLPVIFSMTDADVILMVLTFIDLTLAGNLLLIVIFSGYENFVSKIDVGNHEDRPDWMGMVDFSGLKLKLIASIVAISGIHLLKAFMNITAKTPNELAWLVGIHLTFVTTGVLLAFMDRIHEGPPETHAAKRAKRNKDNTPHA
ncbi:MAG: TIGR00645 family protein [Alphaproteobacteria bacterium]